MSDNYFLFQNDLPFENEEMIVTPNTLHYIRSFSERITRLKIQKQKGDLSTALFEFSVIDSLFKDGVVGDILRMSKFSWIHKLGHKPAYDSLIKKNHF